MTALATGTSYPLLDVFWTMLELFLWVLWFFLLFKVITDIFRSEDLSGWGKAGWTILLILLPFFGAFIYLVARGADMHRRDQRIAAQTDEALRSYIRSAAGTSASTADELAKLAALRDQQVITPEEFERQKAALLR